MQAVLIALPVMPRYLVLTQEVCQDDIACESDRTEICGKGNGREAVNVSIKFGGTNK